MYIAGGTDLLPNLKHRIFRPRHLIALGAALPRGWEQTEEGLKIGAGTRLSQLSSLREIPMLAEAASLVAGPQIRNMGTLGGNVLLDTRCVYYNQTEFWRKSLGWCLKAEGDWCHVIQGPKTCVASQSSDTVPVLLALDAQLRIVGPEGERMLSIRDLYRFDGKDHLKLHQGEVLSEIILPPLPEDHRGSYQKLRTRDAIDFPMLSLAVSGRFEGSGATARVRELVMVVGAIKLRSSSAGSRPLREPSSVTRCSTPSYLVLKRTRPQASVEGPIHGASSWRRHMAGVYARRALMALRDELPESS